ncbi:MAG: threonine synthase [Acidobacteriota bacterium]
MRLVSTAGHAPESSFREAVVAGLAPDGGLYMPVGLPRLVPDLAQSRPGLAFDQLAATLARGLLADEFSGDVIERLTREALDFPVPTRPLTDRLSLLELFHGPTLAFKDFGARFLARFFGHLLAERGESATILVATSGDTGSAVAQGFWRVPGIRVVVLYPAGKVSRFQEAQMATMGGNITAVRVPGVFDDCQRLVKTAFRSPALAGLRLSSANSINIGRLLPQCFYYVASYLAVSAGPSAPITFVVPSGNLGNLTAGLLASQMGVPVATFVAASNANDVLPEFLDTGTYRSRPSVPTLSNAMDVGDPSNFARLLALCRDAAGMRLALRGERVSDADTRAAIRDAWRAHGVVLDPHTAVGYRAATRLLERGADGPVVVLATAHPAKFADTIREELGFEPEMPEAERGWENRALLAVDLPDTDADTLTELLLSLT